MSILETSMSLTPNVNTENNAPVLDEKNSTIFNNHIENYFVSENDTNQKAQLENDFKYISQRKLINILNGIASLGKEGVELLTLLKSKIDEDPKNNKISFIVFKGNEFLKEFNDTYAFQSSSTLNTGNILISIKESPPTEIKGFIFDGIQIQNKLVECINNEAYLIAHELVHVLSFLTLAANERNIDFWNTRKNDWNGFLETQRMQEIKQILEKNFTPEQINKCFEKFFEDTEEARNLLGFEINGSLYGEYCFFTKKKPYYLQTYLKQLIDLSPEEKIFNYNRQ